jgi:predicted TIM-barrel fold metal-dependent hydrolase
MFNDELVIDVHGHMSTPPQFRAFAYNLIALRTADSKFTLTPEQMQGPLDRHLRLLDTHNIDMQMISPRPVAMMHWEQAYLVKAWTKTTNDIIAAQCEMHPKRFVGVAQLNQSADLDTSNCIEELERTVGALGFVGALVNPDPGADRRTPGMNDKYWFPLYKKAEELNATLIVHPSITRDPRLEIVPHSYQYNNLTEETLATLLLEHSDVFDTFPKLRIVICHCGGALRRVLEKGLPADAVAHAHGKPNIAGDSGEMAGGSAVNAGMVREKKQRNTWADNLFFDTCSYDGQLLSGAIKQRGVAQMVFGTEVPGSGSDLINPLTGAPSDDVLALLRSFDFLDDADIKAIVHDNPLRVFPLLQPKIAKLFATASK